MDDLSSGSAGKLYIDDLTVNNSSVLAKFTNLRSLDFNDPPHWFQQDLREAYMEMIVAILHYVPLSNLEELELRVGDATDLEPFAPGSCLYEEIAGVIQRLRHLRLTIDTRKKDAESRVTLLGAVEFYHRNSFHVCKILESARDLRTLRIMVRSTKVLDINNVKSAKPLRLRSLSLEGVSVTVKNLWMLVDRVIGSIVHIYLHNVQLNDGTWDCVIWPM
ncbi:hypothetical protein N7533_003528 [Penicillium manginii]|uniref:uncharacterized protein n=1 Tax=Penicillium manginii TaxID=203109 RepID=UPI0025485B98|nr:uncharacterized protein N7533_003528 [Penicillium manginii]KAJ5761489.1 hypothetical protein N7533_003528 [Penicillium manginii]